jgi:enoyl-CoA hydratase/carnithine racemase
MTEQIRAAADGGILTLTLTRPEKKNALTNAMYETMVRELARAGRDPAIRVVLVEAEGDTFSAGNDIADFAAIATGAKPAATLAAYPFIVALAKFPKPLVAAVQGNAVGIGLTMLLHCDAVYIAEDAKLTASFADLALVPEAGSSLLLPALAGHARAYAVFALGEAIDGRTAEAIGLATAAMPVAQVKEKALEAAHALAAKPAGALKAIKELMRDTAAITATIDRETKIFAERLKTPEAAEAFKAFAERRKPDFSKMG